MIEGTSVNLTCSTDANPAVDEFTWYKVDGGQVVAVGFHALLSTNVSETDSRFFCQVSNRYGSQNSSTTQLDVQCESECDRNTDGKYPPSTWTEHIRVRAFFVQFLPREPQSLSNPTVPYWRASPFLCSVRAVRTPP